MFVDVCCDVTVLKNGVTVDFDVEVTLQMFIQLLEYHLSSVLFVTPTWV